jgi:hypothetical protein
LLGFSDPGLKRGGGVLVKIEKEGMNPQKIVRMAVSCRLATLLIRAFSCEGFEPGYLFAIGLEQVLPEVSEQ